MTSTETSAFTQKNPRLIPGSQMAVYWSERRIDCNQCHRRFTLVGFVATTDHWAHLFNPFLYLQKRHYR